ncbi:MAG: hypothetical protein ACNA8R_15890, partial [Nitriliruptoraceae bacterium]
MGRVGVARDSAAAGSGFAGSKVELVHPFVAFASRHEAAVEIARHIRWHNTARPRLPAFAGSPFGVPAGQR